MKAMLMRYILGFPKSIWLNFRKLPFRQAIRMPILVYRTKLKSISGSIEIKAAKLKTGLIKIGFGTTQVSDIQRERVILNIDGKVVFNGKCKFGTGSRIFVGKDATVSFGDNFNATSHLKLVCNRQMTFGNDDLLSWNCLLMDTDQHTVVDGNTGEKVNQDKPILIGNHVWMGCNTTVMKGAEVADNVIIGSNSVIAGKHLTAGVAIAGNPARTVKENIVWKE